jgi:hypothetical protein
MDYHVIWAECPTGPGSFDWDIAGICAGRSRTPFLAAARVLVELGANPSEKLTGGRTGQEVALSSAVGAAAKLTVKEYAGGGAPWFALWQPFDASVREAAE